MAYKLPLHIDERDGKFYLCWPDGEAYDGPFKTAAAAKRIRTIWYS